MVTEFDYPAWILLLFGIYAISAALGELFKPGFWTSMVDNVIEQPGLRFLIGIVLIALGGALYLVAPWDFSDWMLVAVKFVGAWMVVEGALFLAIGDKFLGFANRMMGAAPRLWAWLSLLIGIALVVVAELRISNTL